MSVLNIPSYHTHCIWIHAQPLSNVAVQKSKGQVCISIWWNVNSCEHEHINFLGKAKGTSSSSQLFQVLGTVTVPIYCVCTPTGNHENSQPLLCFCWSRWFRLDAVWCSLLTENRVRNEWIKPDFRFRWIQLFLMDVAATWSYSSSVSVCSLDKKKLCHI